MNAGQPRPGGAHAKVLFATSNGTGLGHLNRAMGIARRLPPAVEPVIFTLSQAVAPVAGAGFRVEYFPSYRRPASGSDWQWNMRLRRRFERLLADERPDLVVFDGVHPYRAITHVLDARRSPRSVWCRRGLWREGSSPAPLRRTGAFDLVLEPGELAARRDRGPTAARRDEVVAVDPIVYLDSDELLPRERAAAELGLDPDRRTALVSLGQGGSTDRAVERALERLHSEPGLQVAVLRSSIGAELEVPAGVVVLQSTFPMSRYFRAFDLAVAAAGYNAFHELIAFAVPTLFVPMPRETDDQRARAAWAADAGAARAVEGADDRALPARLGELLEPETGTRLRSRCRELFPGNGAEQAAAVVGSLLAGAEPRPGVRDRHPLRRWLHRSAHPVGPSLPLALALTGRDLLRHPERRRPRAVLVALGLEPERLRPRLEAEIAALGVPPDRVLVVTDTLDFAPLRALGVAIVRIPAPAEVGLERGEPAHHQLVERRLRQALAPWRRSPPVRRLVMSAADGR